MFQQGFMEIKSFPTAGKLAFPRTVGASQIFYNRLNNSWGMATTAQRKNDFKTSCAWHRQGGILRWCIAANQFCGCYSVQNVPEISSNTSAVLKKERLVFLWKLSADDVLVCLPGKKIPAPTCLEGPTETGYQKGWQ